jgi:hypothetical protein
MCKIRLSKPRRRYAATEASAKEFTGHHASQYKVISDDMRFYGDQRFKIATVYVLTSGFFINVAKDHLSMLLAIIGILLSYLCFCWDVATQRWWHTLKAHAKELEKLALENDQMIEVYRSYDTAQLPLRGIQKLSFLPRPSFAITSIYFAGAAAWALYFWHSFGCWW